MNSLFVNPILHSKTKHMELDLYFVREKVIAKQLDVNHVTSIDQVENVFIKPLFSCFRHKGKLTVPSIHQLQG